jgi:hypothetical protein
MQVPVACSLSSESAAVRLEEWRQFFARLTSDAQRTGHHRLRVRLNSGSAALVAAVDLARREKACCEFFDFSIEVGVDECWLSVDVPPDAAGVLDDFASLLPRPL